MRSSIHKKMNNIFKQDYKVTAKDRNQKNGHKSYVIWIYGLSGSGKSTIANALEKALFDEGKNTYVLDGDNVRMGLNQNLGFSKEDRQENQRRIAEVAKLFIDAGVICIAAFISPMQSDREMIKAIIGQDHFIEVFVDTPLEECEKRDVKGLYKKARAGEIKNFTGISAPFEKPTDNVITIDTTQTSIEEAIQLIKDDL